MPKFRRILIANRGEIAVRIQRTCRALGIETVALYTPADQNSLHLRLADQCVPLPGLESFSQPDLILNIAKNTQADAIHPGFGFLAERADFIRACTKAGIVFIGPPADFVDQTSDKIRTLDLAQAAGIPVIEHSHVGYNEFAVDSLIEDAERLGYPVVIKSLVGGRGRGERLVRYSKQIRQAVSRSQAESQSVYGQRTIFLEKAILPAHQISVQIVGDAYGNRVHFGEREGSIILGNQKVLEESPAPCLDPSQRQKLGEMALEIAELFDVQNAAAIEFLVDELGNIYFTEIKPRIQVEHPLTELVSRIDLVGEQIRLSMGDELGYTQADVQLSGSALLCRVTAEDPYEGFMPSPGQIRSVRFPGGPDIRVDSYVYTGCEVSAEYDSLIGILVVWGRDRVTCIRRAKRALDEFQITGLSTNLPLLQSLLNLETVIDGNYDTDLEVASLPIPISGWDVSPAVSNALLMSNDQLRDLAIATAVYYLRRNHSADPELPERFITGWHRQSRRLPG